MSGFDAEILALVERAPHSELLEDLNHRHKDFQSSALPTELPSHAEAIETALKYSPAVKTPKTEPTH